MKMIFAPDSFKGSLSAMESCDILERTARRIFPGVETVSVPVADGGEGTVDALLRTMGGERMRTEVTGPLFEHETAEWGLLPDGNTAAMEMAQASGLPYVPANKKDPRPGSPIKPIGGQLKNVANADFSGLIPELKESHITVICDVTNPLLGENGATFIYGPQKGATPVIRDELEAGMAHYAAVIEAALGRDISHFPGAGAAGGLGAALGGILGAQLRSGIDAVLDVVDFDKKLEGVDLAVTGEGRIDGQSVRFGKVPVGVAKRCAAKGIPVLAIVGGIGDGAEGLFDLCESTIMVTASGPMSLEKAMADAPALYEDAAERLFRAVRIGMNLNR